MSTTITPTTVPSTVEPSRRPELSRLGLLESSLVVVRRNLIHIKRMPEMLLDVTIQPVMFVLLFAFVFGGAIVCAMIPGIRNSR